MDFLSRLVSWVFDAGNNTLGSDSEAYLADAVDMNDLERRMRELDARRDIGPFGQNA